MEIKFVDSETLNGTVTFVIIDKGNDEYISMLKSDYDAELEAAKEQSGTL